MKQLNLISTCLVSFSMVFILFAIMSSCKKEEDGPGVGEILVVDSQGNIITDANITLVCESTTAPAKPCDVKETGKTDDKGKFRIEYPNPKVLKIEVKKTKITMEQVGLPPQPVYDTTKLCGESYISIKKDATVQKKVVVLKCD